MQNDEERQELAAGAAFLYIFVKHVQNEEKGMQALSFCLTLIQNDKEREKTAAGVFLVWLTFIKNYKK